MRITFRSYRERLSGGEHGGQNLRGGVGLQVEGAEVGEDLGEVGSREHGESPAVGWRTIIPRAAHQVKQVWLEQMRVHYPHGFLGPPVLNLAPKAVTHLFAEMDQVAAKLRAQPQFVQGDLQFAFYQLQRERIGNLSKDEWLWCFDLWCDHDRGQ